MHDLDLLVPAALVDARLAPDLMRDRPLPHLTRLLTRGDPALTIDLAAESPLTPWQHWVFVERGAAEGVNVAELRAMACGVAPLPDGGRWVGEPAHFSIARDHLRLDDPAAIDLTIVEARALAEVIEPVLVESGWQLEPIEPATLHHWLLQRADGARLSGAAIDRAVGDNVAAWQPRAPDGHDDALAWRRCVNEIQMMWFSHPVNEAREARGLATVNTLWLSGNGRPRTPMPHYRAVDTGLPLLAALPVEPDATRALESFDGLIEPARVDDWSGWAVAVEALDARIGELLAAQHDGRIDVLTLVLCGRERIRTVPLPRGAFGAMWRGLRGKANRPSMPELFTDAPTA